MNYTNSELIKRYERVQASRRTVESTWEEIENFVVPFRGKFFRDDKSEHQVEWERALIFDSTAVTSAQTLSASLHGSLTSPVTQWFNLIFRDKELNLNKTAKEWLDKCSITCFQALQDSDFNLEVNETYIDLVSYGTSVIVEEEVSQTEWQGLDFSSIPIKECFFEIDHRGRVKYFYRKLEWTAVQIKDKFDDIPDRVAAKLGHPDDRMGVLFVIYPRDGVEEGDGVKAPNLRPWGFRYILTDDAVLLGEEGGYYEMPAFIPRWLKTSGSIWGHSPSTVALADIKTLNKQVELILRANEKIIDPTTLTTQRGLFGDLDLSPGAVNVVRDIEAVKAYESGARFDVSELQRSHLVESIRRIYHVDQLELKESPAMTATEVTVRYELMQRLLGPVLGRLQHDLLDPLVERTFRILARAGQLPETPEVVKNAGELDIRYSGPLARAQRSDLIASTERWVGGLAQVAQVVPSVLDNFDGDAYARETSEMMDVPKSMLKSEEEVTAERQARQKKAAEQEQLDKVNQAGQAIESIGKGAQSIVGQPQPAAAA